MDETLKQTIYKLELELQKPEVRKSAEKLDDLISDDLQEVTSSGGISSKANCLVVLPTAPEIKFTMTDFSARRLSDDFVQTFFKTKKVVVGTNIAGYSRRSTIWKNENGIWKMFYHQGTPADS